MDKRPTLVRYASTILTPMGWLSHWWSHEIAHGSKGPLLLAFVAFVVTFLMTRTITRMIRAGRGPFHNVSSGGVHLHHSTPGIILLITGAFLAVGQQGHWPLNFLAALLIGVGSSLVLDEFAMIFHLQDVYWSQEGQLSVQVVTLAAATIGLAIVGVSPAQVPGLNSSTALVRFVVTFGLLIHLALVTVTVLKGKYPMALLGMFLSPLVWVGSVRMARPSSLWARHFYSADRLARASVREKKWMPGGGLCVKNGLILLAARRPCRTL